MFLLLFAAAIGIQSNFEAGCIDRVERVSETHVRLRVPGEADRDNRNRQVSWYYFRVDGAANRELTLDLVDLVGEYDYRPGARAIRKDTPGVYSYDNRNWTHFTDSEWSEGPNNTIRIRFKPRRDPVWIAHVPPYTTVHLERLLSEVRGHPHLRIESAGKTAGGREIPLLTITDRGAPEKKKKAVWLMFRQHAWETGTSWVAEGAVRYLLSPDAAALRRQFIYKIFPMADPDGVARGGIRFNVHGYDLNRNWDLVDPAKMPEIAAQRKTIFEWVDSGRRVDFFLALHNDEDPEYFDGPVEEAFADRFYTILRDTTRFTPTRRPSVTKPSREAIKPGRMQVCQSLFHERRLSCVLMEQAIVRSAKLGRQPTITDRLAFGNELIRAIAAALVPPGSAGV